MTRRILLVEDTDDNREIVRDLMDSVGYELLEANDGAAGLAMATEHRPDLILMDIQLPVMDGYEVTRRIKADPALWHIPIIAVTFLRAFRRRGEDPGSRLRRLRRQSHSAHASCSRRSISFCPSPRGSRNSSHYRVA